MRTTVAPVVEVPRHDHHPLCPLSLTVGPLAGMLNLELADDPHYDGLELQWFDDDDHGTGMLAFLSRRTDRRVDYYPQRGLRLDRAGYEIGGGTGSWTETDFDVARLTIADDGVEAEVRFRDVDGRLITVHVDDRNGRPRHRARFLAPVGAGIDRPAALLLVWMAQFDLVRVTSSHPVVHIGDRTASIGHLPGVWLHRRHLIKYAGPVCAVELNRAGAGAGPSPGAALVELAADGSGIAAVTAESGGHRARVTLGPALPDMRDLNDGAVVAGRWNIEVDGDTLTGGTWRAARRANEVRLALDVTEQWRPRGLPWLMRLVTTVVPVFRRWPTTYRWRATLRFEPAPTMAARWERTDTDRGHAYRRATGS